MKRLSTFLFFAGVLSAQYAAVPGTQFPALESILNAKPAMTKAAGLPSGNCTQSLDLYLNTTNGDLYVCSATNTWLKVMAGNAATATALAATPSLCATGQAPAGILANGNATGCAAAGGSGITTMITGASDPVASCAAPSTSVLALYTQTTTQDIWACVATNTWKKVLSTTGSGTYVATGGTGTAPSNPVSGSVTCWYDSTADTQLCKNSAGEVFTTVKTTLLTSIRTGVKSLWLDSPVSGDSYRLIFEEGKDITLTRVSCKVIGGTNAVINLMKTTETTSGSGGTAALTSDLTCTAGAVAASTTFSSAGVAARVPVALKLTSLSGTNTDLHVFIEYTVD